MARPTPGCRRSVLTDRPARPCDRFRCSIGSAVVPRPAGEPWCGSGLVLAVFSWFNLPRLPGLALAVAVALVFLLRIRLGWLRPATLAAVALGLTSVAIMVAQKRFRYPPDFGWPQQFADLHVWGVVALLLLAADYLVSPSCARERRLDAGAGLGQQACCTSSSSVPFVEARSRASVTIIGTSAGIASASRTSSIEWWSRPKNALTATTNGIPADSK